MQSHGLLLLDTTLEIGRATPWNNIFRQKNKAQFSGRWKKANTSTNESFSYNCITEKKR